MSVVPFRGRHRCTACGAPAQAGPLCRQCWLWHCLLEAEANVCYYRQQLQRIGAISAALPPSTPPRSRKR
jgi:hypothetical protein